MKTCCPYQRGGAIRGFAGPEWQVGGRFSFGRFIWRHARPLLKFLGREALHTGVDIGKDVLAGQSIKEAAISRAKETGKAIARKALSKAEDKLNLLDNAEPIDTQEGSGMARRRRKAPRRKTPRKRINRVRRSKRASVLKRRPKVKHLSDIFDQR
jgi:hypothetical protein